MSTFRCFFLSKTIWCESSTVLQRVPISIILEYDTNINVKIYHIKPNATLKLR